MNPSFQILLKALDAFAHGSPCSQCHHKSNCANNALRRTVRAFFTGGGIKLVLTILRVLLHRRLPKKADLLRDLRDGLRLAGFLASASGVFNTSQCLLRRLRDKEDPWNPAISGLLSGLTVVIDDPSRRQMWTIYAFSRALYPAYELLARRQIVPRVKYSAELLYMFVSISVHYAWLSHPECAPVAAFHKLGSAMGNTSIAKLHEYVHVIGSGGHGKDLCNLLHPNSDCYRSFVERFGRGYVTLSKIYVPLYLLTALVFPRKHTEHHW